MADAPLEGRQAERPEGTAPLAAAPGSPILARLTDKLPEGTGLWQRADLATPMALRVAATLRLADHIAGGLATATELAGALNVNADALDRLIRHLAGVGVLVRDDAGRCELTDRGRELLDGHPSHLRAELDVEGGLGRADLAFIHLLHSVRTGEAAYPRMFGGGFWDDLASDPARTSSYDRQMGFDVAAWAARILAAYDWASLGHVVDVGGGDGTLLALMLREHPKLRGTVFDQPLTAAAARGNLAAGGLADRCDVVAGDFFDPLPRGAGGYVLCAVLHDWNDGAARSILQRCAKAAAPKGKVFVIEKTGAGGEAVSTEMDLRLLVYFGGKQRGVAELTELATSSGLSVASVHPAGDISILELVVPAV